MYIKITLFIWWWCCISHWAGAQANPPASCTAGRYLQPVFNTTQWLPNKVYTKDVPEFYLGIGGIETVTLEDMVMDIRLPPNTDTLTRRPVMIWGHGGGFLYVWGLDNTVAVGSKNNDDIQAIIDTFAQRGFVTASIQYRRGVDPSDLSGGSAKRAVWRGAQDMNAAIRYFKVNADKFNIDPNYIFVGGSSAGAFAAIHSTFIDADEKFGAANAQYNLLGMEIAADLGNMNQHSVESITNLSPYQTTTVAGNVGSLPTGVMACWGAIDNLNHLAGSRQAPMIMFHGLADVVVFPDCNEPFVGLITLPEFCGSQEMAPRCANLGIPHEVTLAPGQPHEYWGALNGGWITGQPDEDFQVIINDIAQFVYNIMRPATPLISGNAVVCGNDTSTYTLPALPNDGSYYCYGVTGGTVVANTANTIAVHWNNNTQQGSLWVRSVSANVVESYTTTLSVSISQTPTAISLSNLSASGFTATWDGSSTQDFVLQYRALNNPLWNTTTVSGNSYTLSNLNPCTPYELRLTAYCGNNTTTSIVTQTTNTQATLVPIKVMLEGAYLAASGNMRTALQNANLLPLQQPYHSAPWAYNGSEQVLANNAFPPNTVDWLLVELRLASNPATIVEQRAALLLNNGIVRDLDDPNGVRFCQLQTNTNYKIVVRHRNHVAIMSRAPWNSSSSTLYDFSASAVTTEGGVMQQVAVGNYYAMRAGDCNANGIINRSDYNLYQSNNNLNNVYANTDTNLNGDVNSFDFAAMQPNLKAIAPTIVRY